MVANLNKIIYDGNRYLRNQTILEWPKYKFHSVIFSITSNSDYSVSDIQISLFGTNVVTCNNNKFRDGSFGLKIDNLGKIIIEGTSNTIYHSYITEIYMWN